MPLDKNDTKTIRAIIIDALETVVLPRFDEHDKRFDEHDKRFNEHSTQMVVQAQSIIDLKAEMRSGFSAVNKRIDNLSDELIGRITALEADIKELYFIVAKLEKSIGVDKKFMKLKLEQKVFQINNELLATAKQAGITLPR